MKIAILSLFPEYFQGPLNQSILKQAQDKGILEIRLVNIRDFADNKHHRVDDRCYGGGPGMVLMAPPVTAAIISVKTTRTHTIYVTPRGRPLTPQKCRDLAQCEELVILCGHYEGVDERVLENEIDEEISIGDYVLTNGCLAAIVIVDAMSRFIPGVIGDGTAADDDSFEKALLEHPHYTRPEVFEGKEVPEVLLQGNHANIADWRREQSLEMTKRVRPELYVRHLTQEVGAEKIDEEAGTQTLTGCVLFVRDLKQSVQFYRRCLGAHLEQNAKSEAVLKIGNFKLVLVQSEESSDRRKQSAIFKLTCDEPHEVERVAKRAKPFKALCDFSRDDDGVTQALIEDLESYRWSVKSKPKKLIN